MTSNDETRDDNILLVEDEVDIRRLIEFNLKGAGYNVLLAPDGQEALRKAGEAQISLVILDLMLPDIDGVEVCQELRRKPGTADVPIIILSAKSQVKDKIRGLEAGADEYLTKPIDMKELIARVAALILHTNRLRKTQPVKAGEVFGFIGVKGGVGATTVVLNVGALLAQQGKSVIALELQPYFGDFALHLKCSPVDNLTHLLKLEAEKIDKRALSTRLYKLAYGMQILYGPQQLEDFGALDPLGAEAIVRQSALAADYTVIDLPREPSKATRAVVQHCDLVLLVMEPDPLSVGSAKFTLQFLEKCGIGSGQVRAIIVRRSTLSTNLTLREIDSQIRCEIIGVMPFANEAIMAAISQGKPLALYAPEHATTVTLKEMINRLTTDIVGRIRF